MFINLLLDQEKFEIYASTLIINESFLNAKCLNLPNNQQIVDRYLSNCNKEYKYTTLFIIKQNRRRRSRKVNINKTINIIINFLIILGWSSSLSHSQIRRYN